MFTGIITHIGKIVKIDCLNAGKKIQIRVDSEFEFPRIGDSISCSGICLTVSDLSKDKGSDFWFEVEVWSETLKCTTAHSWEIGTSINLEKALKIGDVLGGHFVSGHVDGVAEIISEEKEGDAIRFGLKAPAKIAKFIASKGSITLDGVSLTINEVCDSHFDVLIIAHTLKTTTWRNYTIKDKVNIEGDLLARYTARFLEGKDQKKQEFLK